MKIKTDKTPTDKTPTDKTPTDYCVFESVIDGQGYLNWDLIFVSMSIEGARKLISKLPIYQNYPDIKWEPVHPSMTKQNNYCVVGTRQEISTLYDIEKHDFPDDFPHNAKGYVIEAQTIQ